MSNRESEVCDSKVIHSDDYGSQNDFKICNHKIDKHRYYGLNIYTFNTRSLGTQEKYEKLILELSDENWDIIGLSEVRRLGKEIHETDSEIFYYIGKTKGLYGVGILIKKYLKNFIINYGLVSERICWIILEIENIKIGIIQVYAPTTKATYDKMNTFYDELNRTYEETKSQSQYMIVMGDFNAQLGKKKSTDENAMGNFGYEERNNRGIRLLSFLHETNMQCGNSFFQKKDEVKWTWLSPNGKTKNLIDYILINNRSVLKDVSVIKNFRFKSDHRLLRAKVKFDLETLARVQQKLGMPLVLNKEKKREYINLLSSKISQLDFDNINNPQKMYNSFVEMIISAASKTIMEPISKKYDKISAETKQLIHSKEIIKNKNNLTVQETEELKKLEETINTKIKYDIQNYNRKTTKTILRTPNSIKSFLNLDNEWINVLLENNAKTITNRMSTNKYTSGFYDSLLNSNNESESKIPNPANPFKLNKVDINKAIDSLKKDKPDNDGIDPKMITSAKSILTPILVKIFNAIINNQQIPQQWQENTISKKSVSSLTTLYKLFSISLYNEMKKSLNFDGFREQAGFRTEYFTLYHHQTINQLIEKHINSTQQLYLLFVNFEKPFDTIKRENIWKALNNQQIHPKIIETIKTIYDRIYQQTAKSGLRQGDPLTPLLFSAVLEEIFKLLDWTKKGLNIRKDSRRLNNLRFVDDVVLLSHSSKQICSMINKFSTICSQYGLSINLEKTKIMTNLDENNILLHGKKIEYVKDFIYLGQIKSFTNQQEKEIERRIQKSKEQYNSIKNIFNFDLSDDMKTYIFNFTILRAMTYGLETLGLCNSLYQKLKNNQNKIKKQLNNKIEMVDVTQTMQEFKLMWATHIERQNDEGWANLVTKWKPSNKKKLPGRPKLGWADDVKKIDH